MAYSEQDNVGVISGVGEVTAAALQRLGIFKIGHLLAWYPRLYIDASRPVPVNRLEIGRLSAIRVRILSVNERRTRNRGVSMLEAVCSDNTGTILVRWFNQKFLTQKLKVGSEWILIGSTSFFGAERTMLSPLIESSPHILAVYAQTKGLTSKMLRGFISWALENVKLAGDTLPSSVLQKEGLLEREVSLRAIHRPKTMDDVPPAQRRIAFEEVFWFFARMAASREQVKAGSGVPIPYDLGFLQEAVKQLPFELTPGQKKAVWEMVQEMENGSPMTRLLNGDVGSGKTVVAALLAAVVAKAGKQTAILVPTEILAKQHHTSISGFLSPLGLKVALWTAAQKDELGKVDVVVGTHALLQEEVNLGHLALLVIDEQHRFGVRQRQLLRGSQATVPHLLSMTATPIPRTLALALYGDLSVTLLKDKPKDRLPIVTQIIRLNHRPLMHQRIMKEIQAGHQIFVICPLIEEKKPSSSEGDELSLFQIPDTQDITGREKKTVVAEAERLREKFPEYGVVEVIHGKMKAEEKRKIMERMARGEIQVLVATSVIEVGVDIPRATVMVIEGAERFGLAQLHQFRGRVGRGKDQSYCFLCPGIYGEQVEKRLRVLVEHQSGFEVAEQDLALRGPGELVGQVQSGLPDFRMASLTDTDFLQHVKELVEEFIHEDPGFLQRNVTMTYAESAKGLE